MSAKRSVPKPRRRSQPKSGPVQDDPWALVWGQPYIDAERLAAAIDADLEKTPSPDFRTRLLVRDSARALKKYWSTTRYRRWLATSPAGKQIRDILTEKLGRTGFHNIRKRLVASVNQDLIEQVFRLLGEKVHDPVEVNIAGSVSTLILGLTVRPTDDIDFVDEVPEAIRKQHGVVQRITREYGLTLGHVQSHYLPANWKSRRKYLGEFGQIRVYTIDPYDVFVSKLSSKQKKHQDDLRVLATKLDKEIIRQRLTTDGKAFLENEFLEPVIDASWRFIYGEPAVPRSTQPPAPSSVSEATNPADQATQKKPGRKRRS